MGFHGQNLAPTCDNGQRSLLTSKIAPVPDGSVRQTVIAGPSDTVASGMRGNIGLSLIVSVGVMMTACNLVAPAVVDTAAQVSVLSDTFWVRMGSPKLEANTMTLRNVQKGSAMIGRVLKNVKLHIGKKTYEWDLIVASILEDLILGIDFLKSVDCIVDLRKNVLIIKGEVVPAYLVKDSHGKEYHVSLISSYGSNIFPGSREGK